MQLSAVLRGSPRLRGGFFFTTGPRLPKLIESILAVPFEKIVRKQRLAKMSADHRRRYRSAIEKAVERLTRILEQIDALES